MNAAGITLRDRGRGMYGPFRLIVAVGPHEATGTVVTLECGHTWTLVPHAHMDPTKTLARRETHQCLPCDRVVVE